MPKQMYMNTATGKVAERDEWLHTDLAGNWIDPVETGEVVAVVWNADNRCWVEGDTK